MWQGKKCTALIILLLQIAAGVAPCYSQAAKGGLRGQVVDADFGQPVPGATVRLPAAGESTTTDDQGNFFFNELVPGSFTIEATKDGYVRNSSQAAVQAGSITETRVSITADVVTLEEFVVSADDIIEQEDIQLLDVRQDLASFADAIGADFISQSGAGDAGEALQKVVGTSVADDKFVVVRGLSDRYNTVYLNGARIPSSDPDKRAVNVDLFPSDFLDSLTNYKTFTPNLPAEATGGHIDILTKTIPQEDFYGASLSIGYDTLATGRTDFLTYNGSGTGILGTAKDRQIPDFMKSLVGGPSNDPNALPSLPASGAVPSVVANRDRVAQALNINTGTNVSEAPLNFSFSSEIGQRFEFWGSPAGILGGITYSKEYDYDPFFTQGRAKINFDRIVPTAYFEGPTSEEQLVAGALLAGGIELSDDHKLSATLLLNRVAEDKVNFFVGESESSTESIAGDPTNNVPPLEEATYQISESIQYTERTLAILQLAGSHRFDGLKDSTIRWSATYGQTSQDQPDVRTANYGVRNRQNQYFLISLSGDEIERIWRRIDDRNYNINFDFELPLFGDEEVKNTSLHFGSSFDNTFRDYRADNFAYGTGPPGSLTIDTTPVPDNRQLLTFGDLLGALDRNPAPGNYLFRRFGPDLYSAEQNILAGYFMIESQLAENFEATYGLRVEVFDLSLFAPNLEEGNFLQINPNTGDLVDAEDLGKGKISETSYHPALSLKWDFFDDMTLRFAASRTTARPSFKELAPVFTRDVDDTSRFSGNIFLETSTIDNLDVRWEWFPNPGDVFAVSFFTKFIDKPIELARQSEFTFFRNEESARLYGFEIEASKNLGFIDPIFEGFTISTNFTKLVSRVQLGDEAASGRRLLGLDVNRPLQGQPDYIFNFNMSYDNEELGFFAGLFLNITGPTLFATGSVSAILVPDVFQEPFTSLDLTMSQRINDTWKISFKASNLLGSGTERVYSDGSLFSSSNGARTYSIGISAEW